MSIFFQEIKIELTVDEGGAPATFGELVMNHELEIILPFWYGDECRIGKYFERIKNEKQFLN